MGGYGSGRRSDAKTTTESQYRIDLRWLKKQGFLRPGFSRSLSWSLGGKKTGAINYRMGKDHMILDYRNRPNGGDWTPVEQTIKLVRTPCNYGGYRTWFLCPRCWKRVIILYGAGKYFYCRHCYNLTYASQQESRSDRLMRKARKIRERLGASNDLFEPIWIKPKYMHQKTFDRLRREADYANEFSLSIAERRFGISI